MTRSKALSGLFFSGGFAVLSQAAWAQSAPAKQDGDSQNPSATTVGQLIVTAPRAASTARLEELTAPNLISVQSAEQIAKYPDFDAAEAISRVPGVSLTGDTGEGRFVNIRGIDNNLNGTTFGGVVILNTQPQGTLFGSGRGVELDTIPVGSVDRIVVTKTGLPDHEAEGLGGSIELTPRSAAAIRKAFFAEVVLGAGYEGLRPNWSPRRAEIVIGGRLGAGGFSADGPLAFVITASENDDRRAIDDIEPFYAVDAGYPNTFPGADKVLDSINFRRYNYHRRRFGVGGELTYQANDRNNFYLRANVAGYIESVNNQQFHYTGMEFRVTPDPTDPIFGLFVSPTGSVADGSAVFDPANPKGFLAPAAGTQFTQRNEEETHRNTVVAFGGASDVGPATLTYQVAYSRATFSKGHDNNPFFNGPGVSLSYDNNTDPRFPTFRILNGVNIHDPAQYNLTAVANLTDQSVDEEWSYKADVAFPVHLIGDNDRVKFGAKARLRDKIDTPITQVFVGGPPLTLANVQGAGPFTNFYGGRYDIGFNADPNAFAAFFQKNQAAFSELPSDSTLNAAAFFKAREDIYAAYGQYEATLGPWGLLAGVRVESTRAVYAGNVVTTTPDPVDPVNNPPVTVITPTSKTHNYTNVFPTVQLRYQFSPAMVVRATYSTGIGRPGFTQIAPSTQIQLAVFPATVTTGNPDLKPITGSNFDLSFDYNLPHAGLIHLGAFDKEFSNYVVGRSVFGAFPGVPGTPFITGFINAPSAHARGIEAAFAQTLWFLPGPFDGLGLSGNVTLVDSDIELHPGEHHLLPATSRFTANGSIFYSGHGLDVQLSAQDVGPSLTTIGAGDLTDVTQARRITVDLTSSYAVRPNVQIYFNAKNLLNTPLLFDEGRPNRPIQREFYDLTLEFGVRAQF